MIAIVIGLHSLFHSRKQTSILSFSFKIFVWKNPQKYNNLKCVMAGWDYLVKRCICFYWFIQELVSIRLAVNTEKKN